MKRIRFSLLAFFVFLTLCGVCCGAAKTAGVRTKVSALRGDGDMLHLGPITLGVVDWKADDRGWLAGVWYRTTRDDGGIAPAEVEYPVVVIELRKSPSD